MYLILQVNEIMSEYFNLLVKKFKKNLIKTKIPVKYKTYITKKYIY